MEDLKEIRADLANIEAAARAAAEREARALAADYAYGQEIYEGNIYDGTGGHDDW